ncbi:hypothetical protein Hanom_Chr17g01524871 [Helianthus anomalus]
MLWSHSSCSSHAITVFKSQFNLSSKAADFCVLLVTRDLSVHSDSEEACGHESSNVDSSGVELTTVEEATSLEAAVNMLIAVSLADIFSNFTLFALTSKAPRATDVPLISSRSLRFLLYVTHLCTSSLLSLLSL